MVLVFLRKTRGEGAGQKCQCVLGDFVKRARRWDDDEHRRRAVARCVHPAVCDARRTGQRMLEEVLRSRGIVEGKRAEVYGTKETKYQKNGLGLLVFNENMMIRR